MSNAKNKTPKAPKAAKPAVEKRDTDITTLAGYTAQAAQVEINGDEVSSNDILYHAFKASQLSVDEWNALDDAARAEQFEAAIEDMRAADKQDGDQELTPTIEPEVLAQLVPVKKFGEPNLHIHPDHLDEYRKLGWEVIN